MSKKLMLIPRSLAIVNKSEYRLSVSNLRISELRGFLETILETPSFKFNS